MLQCSQRYPEDIQEILHSVDVFYDILKVDLLTFHILTPFLIQWSKLSERAGSGIKLQAENPATATPICRSQVLWAFQTSRQFGEHHKTNYCTSNYWKQCKWYNHIGVTIYIHTSYELGWFITLWRTCGQIVHVHAMSYNNLIYLPSTSHYRLRVSASLLGIRTLGSVAHVASIGYI